MRSGIALYGLVLPLQARYSRSGGRLHFTELIANDSEYGLVAGSSGNDPGLATHILEQLEAGQTFVNEWFSPAIEGPSGGFKRSRGLAGRKDRPPCVRITS